MIVLIAVLIAAWMVVRRVLLEDSPLLAPALTYTLSCLALLTLANTSLDRPLIALPLLALCVGLGVKTKRSIWTWPALSKTSKAVLILVALVVVIFTNLSQNLYLDDDYWIHFPLQGLLKAVGLPVRHPFFSEILMSGHYGRDLLVASISRLTGISLIGSMFWQTTLCQLASLLTIFGLVYASSRSQLSATLASLLIFFGICVGGRGGLLDCFQNNNALTYLVTLSLFHLLYLVYLKPSAARVLITSWALGSFALIYETHFGLFGLTLAVVLAATRRKEFAVIGALALLLAIVEGGPITELVKQRIHPSQRVWTPGELNQHQIIKVTFPKKELFEIQLANGDYQRRSLAYQLLPDLGTLTSITSGTPYRPLWSWDVLQIHWLATLLAPLSGLFLWRRRDDPVGIGLWVWGGLAFLTPALVNFGPVYEFEYFRWQFAAGFAFAGALGCAAGRFFEQRSPRVRALGLALLLLLGITPPLAIFLPRLVHHAAQHARLADAFWPRPQTDWVLAQSPLLGGFDDLDIRAASELEQRISPGDRLLVNSPSHCGEDIHFDSTLSGLTGARVVGHSFPWPQEAVGMPPFHRSAPTRVFWRHPSDLLLDQLKVDWVYLRPGPEPTSMLRHWLDDHAQPVWQHGDYRLYQRARKTGKLLDVSTTSASVEPPNVEGLPVSALTSELVDFGLAEDGNSWAWGFVARGAAASTVALEEVVSWQSGPCAALTPPQAGDYDLVFFKIDSGHLQPSSRRLPLRVVERR